MTSRERVLMTLNHKEPDRIPMVDSPWSATLNRWKNEGLPSDIDINEYFNWDFAFNGADTSPRFPVRTIEKNDTFIVATTPYGGKRRNFRDYTTTPEVIDWPIKSKDDWKEIKKKLAPEFTRVDWATGLASNNKAKEEAKFIFYGGGYGFDILQNYMKTEELLIAMVEEPDWIKEMIMTLAELNLVMLEFMMKNGFAFDGTFFYNDMGYKNGPLFSPETYMKVHFQADRMVFDYCHSKNLKVFLHSCGNVKQLIPMLIEAGLDCLQPLEVKAGMDVRELKAEFGDKLCFMGGIDVRLMNLPDKSKIEEEIRSKFEVAKKGGGYIYHSDHSIPNNVSFQDFCAVMELVKKYGVYEKPPVEIEQPVEVMQVQESVSVPEKTPGKKGLFKFLKRGKEPVQKEPEEKKQKPVEPPQTESEGTEKKNLFGFLKKGKK